MEQADYDNFYAYADVERIETQWSETILRGLAGLLRTKTKKLNRMVQTKKKWLYKPLIYFKRLSIKNGISDTDVLINTIRACIKK